MAVLSKEDFLAKIQERIGEDNSDEAIGFIEDMTDTYNSMETQLADTTDWKAKFEENDAMWKQKYKDRFFTGVQEENKDEFLEEDNKEITSFDELFSEVKEK